MNDKKNQDYHNYFYDKNIAGSLRSDSVPARKRSDSFPARKRSDSVPARPTVPKQPLFKSAPRGTPSVNAFIGNDKQNQKVMEHMLGGPVPSLPSKPSAQNSQVFSHSPEVGMNRINQTLNPMANPSPFLPVMGESQQGGNPSIQIDEAALFDQYADYYKRQGMLAMEDTVGRVAAMTGGYGNSYAEVAGNQAYDSHIADYLKVINGTSQSVGSGVTGSWLDDLIGDQPSTGFTGTTAQEAQAYVQSQGLPADSLADLMSDAEWRRQKALHSRHGGGGVEVTEYDTYAEYLAAFVAYATEMYSG